MNRIVIILFCVPYFNQLVGYSQNQELNKFFSDKAAKEEFSGSVLISKNGKILLRTAYGYKDFAKRVPNTPETQFRIGSLTKQFTASLILLLESEGKLKTSDPMVKYLPQYPNAENITLDHLIHHSSGIPNFIFFPDYRKFMNQKHELHQMVLRFKDLPLEFSPGTAFNYSNSGYYLLGVIIEQVTGMTYEEALHQYILSKIPMPHTGIETNSSKLAKGHIIHGSGMTEAPDIHLSVPYSAGAMYSTVDDLYAWQGKIKGSFFSPAHKQKRLDIQFDNYGYGIWIDHVLSQSRIWHTGGINGFRAVMSFYPETEVIMY